METNWRKELSDRLPTFYTDKGDVDHRLVWHISPAEGDWSTLRIALWDERQGSARRRLVAQKAVHTDGDLDLDLVVNRLLNRAQSMANMVKVVDAVADTYS